MKRKYIDATIKEYVDALAGDSPAPGGGSVSALSAALGMSLILMSANIALKRKEFSNRDLIEKIVVRGKGINRGLLELVDKDIEAYQRVASIGFSDKENKEFQNSLREAISIPLSVSRFSCEGFECGLEVMDKVRGSIRNDIVVGALLLYNALKGSIRNAQENMKFLSDDEPFAEALKQLESLKEKEGIFKKRCQQI